MRSAQMIETSCNYVGIERRTVLAETAEDGKIELLWPHTLLGSEDTNGH